MNEISYGSFGFVKESVQTLKIAFEFEWLIW